MRASIGPRARPGPAASGPAKIKTRAGYTDRYMVFPVEVVLKGRDLAETRSVVVEHGEPSTWTDPSVRDVLIEILRTIDRVEHHDRAGDLGVVLQGFSWIVEPVGDQVVIAIEIPMGAAVAGPFSIDQAVLDAMITRVLRAERQVMQPSTIH
jgi:hypothetical protein